MDILLKGHAKMIIWFNLRVRIRVKRTVHRFITDTNVIVTLAGYKFHSLSIETFKVVNLINLINRML